MRQLLSVTILTLSLALSTSLVQVGQVPDPEHCESGRTYSEHVTDHALGDRFSGEDNPGVHHEGFSVCLD